MIVEPRSSPLTTREVAALSKDGWNRTAKDLVDINKLAQKHPFAEEPTPSVPTFTPESVVTSPVVETVPNTPDVNRDEARLDNLRQRGMFSEQFGEVDQLRDLQDRANRINLEQAEAEELKSFKDRMHGLEEAKNSGRPMTGNDQVELDYYHLKFSPEVAGEQSDKSGMEDGLKQLGDLRAKPGFDQDITDRTNLKSLEEKYGAELDHRQQAEKETEAAAIQADENLARTAAEAASRVTLANDTAREARQSDPLSQPEINPTDIESANAYNQVVNELRARANGFGEPLSDKDQARLARLEATYNSLGTAGGPETPPTEPNITNILGQVDDGKVLSPEDQAIYDAWKTKHADVIEPGQLAAPETPENTSDEEPPSPEDPTGIHYDDKVGEPPETDSNSLEDPNHDDQELAAADTAVAEQKAAIYDQVLEKVRSGQPLTDEDKKILQEHDDAVVHIPAADTAPSTALVPVTPPEDPALEGEVVDGEFTETGAGGPPQTPVVESTSAVPIRTGLFDGLRANAERFAQNPVGTMFHLLEDTCRSWWAGVTPYQFFEGRTMGQMVKEGDVNLGEWLKNWDGLSMAFYTAGVGAGAVVDVLAILPGLNLLRPGLAAAFNLGLPIAIGASETARRRFIMEDNNLNEDEKKEELSRIEREHPRASALAVNFARGAAAGMITGTIVHSLGIDTTLRNWWDGIFKKPGTVPNVPITPPIETPTPPVNEPDIVFKAVENTGFHQATGIDQLNLPHWTLQPGTSRPEDIVGYAIRRSAKAFGTPGQPISYSQLSPAAKALIQAIKASSDQATFLANGGQTLINNAILP